MDNRFAKDFEKDFKWETMVSARNRGSEFLP